METKKSRLWWIPLALALVLLAGVAAVVVGKGSGTEPVVADEDEETGWERWVMLDEPRPAPRPLGVSSDAPRPLLPPAGPAADARRERWRERWRQSVEIVPLGPRAPGFDADSVRGALAPGREALIECVSQQGGWRALRQASRAEQPRPTEGAQGRRRRQVSFDVSPDGTVDTDTVRFEPALPEAFDGCLRTYYASARFEPGSDGAHVELPLGGGRGRPTAGGDGGVGSFRRGGRGGAGGAGGGAREWGGRGERGGAGGTSEEREGARRSRGESAPR